MAVGTDVIGTGAGTITQGQRTLADIGATRKRPQWDGNTVNISAMVAPLSVFIDKTKKGKTVGQASYFHLETDYNPRSVATSTSYTTETTIALASGQGAYVEAGSTLKNVKSGEVMRVTARSSDTLTVTRGYMGTTVANIDSGQELNKLGSAFAEGSAAPNGISSEPTLKTNYCQTFRAALELSGRDINSDNFGEDETERIKKNTLEDLMLQRETAFLFNPGFNTSDPTATAGAEYWINTNVTNVGGALTETGLEDWWVGVMRRNFNQSADVLVLGGEKFRRALDGFGRDNIRFTPDDTVAGIEIGAWSSSFGRLKVVPHGLLSPLGTGVGASTTGTNLNTNGSAATIGTGGWTGYAFAINTALIGKRSFKNRGDVMLEADAQTPGTDGKKWVYTQDCGLYMASEKQHGKLYGITG